MKSLILAAALAIPLMAQAADNDPFGCAGLADSARSMALARDKGLPEYKAHQGVDDYYARHQSEYDESSLRVAQNTTTYVYAHKDTDPQAVYWAVYGICVQSVKEVLQKKPSM